jgi:phage terminase small subunit
MTAGRSNALNITSRLGLDPSIVAAARQRLAAGVAAANCLLVTITTSTPILALICTIDGIPLSNCCCCCYMTAGRSNALNIASRLGLDPTIVAALQSSSA